MTPHGLRAIAVLRDGKPVGSKTLMPIRTEPSVICVTISVPMSNVEIVA